MLIKCPECDLQVSDKAISCPHCGYPLQPEYIAKPKSKNKRMRLPNGFGQITKINYRNLRKPYRAMIPAGKTEEGKYKSKILGYFETYNDAYIALLEYNRNPYEITDVITMKDLYNRWSETYFKTLKSDNSTRTITSAWSYCSELYNVNIKEIRVRHLKGCIENGFVRNGDNIKYPSANTKSRIKSIFNLMFDYALEYELVDKNYARMFKISDDIIKENESVKRGHISFTDDEMNLLWENINEVSYVDVVLLQCYSGLRPQEIGLIRVENVDLDKNIMIGGMKTEAGTNRIIPIHKNIKAIVEKYYNEALELESEYLINCTDTNTHRSSLKFTYDKYKFRFEKIVKRLKLNPDHRPHDGRKQFVTLAKKYDVDEYAIKYIVGHSINDLTEKIYTDRNINWLLEEIQKIR